MNLQIQPGDKREIAETLGRYFEANKMPFHIEEKGNGTLYIGFQVDGHQSSVTVSFDSAAYDAFTQWDAEQKRVALTRIGHDFERLMKRRSDAALAGEFHINRF